MSRDRLQGRTKRSKQNGFTFTKEKRKERTGMEEKKEDGREVEERRTGR